MSFNLKISENKFAQMSRLLLRLKWHCNDGTGRLPIKAIVNINNDKYNLDQILLSIKLEIKILRYIYSIIT